MTEQKVQLGAGVWADLSRHGNSSTVNQIDVEGKEEGNTSTNPKQIAPMKLTQGCRWDSQRPVPCLPAPSQQPCSGRITGRLLAVQAFTSPAVLNPALEAGFHCVYFILQILTLVSQDL